MRKYVQVSNTVHFITNLFQPNKTKYLNHKLQHAHLSTIVKMLPIKPFMIAENWYSFYSWYNVATIDIDKDFSFDQK